MSFFIVVYYCVTFVDCIAISLSSFPVDCYSHESFKQLKSLHARLLGPAWCHDLHHRHELWHHHQHYSASRCWSRCCIEMSSPADGIILSVVIRHHYHETKMRPRALPSLFHTTPPQSAIDMLLFAHYWMRTLATTPASEAEGWWWQHSSSRHEGLRTDLGCRSTSESLIYGTGWCITVLTSWSGAGDN